MINYPLSFNSIQTRVLEEGQGDHLAVCIHGIGSRADRFRPVLPALANAGYRAVALDLPGHGFADKGDLPLSVPAYAEYVLALIRHYSPSQVTVIGTSLGGNIGGYLIRLADPGELTQLVMVGTLGVVPLPQDALNSISKVILRRRSVEDCRDKLRALIYDDSRVTDNWAVEESLINNSRGADESFARLGEYVEQHLNSDLILDDLAATDVELGLMWGSRDVIVDVATGRECVAALPTVPMVWVDDTGHAPYWERPEAFVAGMRMLFDGSLRNGILETHV